jgi:hypothetical protein
LQLETGSVVQTLAPVEKFSFPRNGNEDVLSSLSFSVNTTAKCLRFKFTKHPLGDSISVVRIKVSEERTN